MMIFRDAAAAYSYAASRVKELEAELARVREELERERDMSIAKSEELRQSYADYDKLHERTERVARRAYWYGRGEHKDGKPFNADEAVAQAMREGGHEVRPVRHALNCSGYYGNEPCDCGAK